MTSVASLDTAGSRSEGKGDSAEAQGRLPPAVCWAWAEYAQDCHPLQAVIITGMPHRWSAAIGQDKSSPCVSAFRKHSFFIEMRRKNEKDTLCEP